MTIHIQYSKAIMNQLPFDVAASHKRISSEYEAVIYMQKLVVFSGAGMSAESGINTFRDSNGLWEQHRIEDVATPEAWTRDPELVQRFYNERRKHIDAAEPNDAHNLIAELDEFFDVQVITQNIDDLHERAGSQNVRNTRRIFFRLKVLI